MAESNSQAVTPAPANVEAEKPILAWEAKEFAEYDRDKRWYVLVMVAGALIVAGAILFAVISGNVRDAFGYGLMALVFALATFVVLRHADDSARTVSCAINKLGVQTGHTFHPYNELKSYWIIYKPPVQTLTLQGTSRFKPLIKIDLAKVDPLTVQSVLKDYLPEETKRTEDFLDKFSRLIKL